MTELTPQFRQALDKEFERHVEQDPEYNREKTAILLTLEILRNLAEIV